MKFNYFFNSLYLLTNKTQMKMKKTQSLKLMLLGLVACFSSTNVWAQYTASNGVVYDTSGEKAKVVAISSTALDATTKKAYILIADEIAGKKVNEIDENWLDPTKNPNYPFQNASGSIGTSTTTTPGAVSNVTVTTPNGSTTVEQFNVADLEALKDYTIKFEYEAAEITTIERAKIDPIIPQIYHFGIYKKSGITVIPEYLFANKTTKNTAAADAAAAQAVTDKATAQGKKDAAQTNIDALEETKTP